MQSMFTHFKLASHVALTYSGSPRAFTFPSFQEKILIVHSYLHNNEMSKYKWESYLINEILIQLKSRHIMLINYYLHITQLPSKLPRTW